MKTYFQKLILAGGLAFCCSFICTTAQAQNERVRDNNPNGWYMYFGSHNLTDKWGLHTEVQIRRYETITKPQQLLIRTGINYNLTDRVMLTGGYGYILTYPYGDFPAKHDFPENRLYQQVLIKGNEGIFFLQHRYRLEQRWITFPDQESAIFTNRFRYLLRASVPVVGKTIDSKEPYLSAYNEAFVNFGKNVQHNIFDQNRAYIALGYKFSPMASLEIGYLNQIVQQRNGKVFEYNHTLQLGLNYNLDFRKP